MHIIILQKINRKDEERGWFDGGRCNLLVAEGVGGLLLEARNHKKSTKK